MLYRVLGPSLISPYIEQSVTKRDSKVVRKLKENEANIKATRKKAKLHTAYLEINQ